MEIMSGTYTIVSPKTGAHRTVKISDDDFEWMTTAPAAGTRKVSAMVGSDNENSFKAIGTVTPDGALRVWSAHTGRLDFIAATKYLLRHGAGQEIELGKAYAVISGRCWLCNLKLTNPASVVHGYGKDCAENNDLPYDRKATPALALASEAQAA